jgi:triphosphoribosyl-dephospho-CoA synthase
MKNLQSKADFIRKNAIDSLHAELELYPKAGLVSFVDSGAHKDMTCDTFLKSIASLENYFYEIALAAMQSCHFQKLKLLAIEAENKMLKATGGINTHRGTIFSLGLLSAASAWRLSHNLNLDTKTIIKTMITLWGQDIAQLSQVTTNSHGDRVRQTYGARGACEEALLGFPILEKCQIPNNISSFKEKIQCFYSILAQLDDTNLLHRGGREGLNYMQTEAQKFLNRGGVSQNDWFEQTEIFHKQACLKGLSPGGAADMFAAVIFIGSIKK